MDDLECRRALNEKSDLKTGGGRGWFKFGILGSVLFAGLALILGMSASWASRMNSFSSLSTSLSAASTTTRSANFEIFLSSSTRKRVSILFLMHQKRKYLYWTINSETSTCITIWLFLIFYFKNLNIRQYCWLFLYALYDVAKFYNSFSR